MALVSELCFYHHKFIFLATKNEKLSKKQAYLDLYAPVEVYGNNIWETRSFLVVSCWSRKLAVATSVENWLLQPPKLVELWNVTNWDFKTEDGD